MSAAYDFNTIEPQWQDAWEREGAFVAANPGQPGSERPPFYVLDFFPYPSGAGLHVGHPLGYIASDIVARFQRMRGCNVLHPMGWDAFGLPAEQYAVETGVHPSITTQKNIDTYKRQLRSIGMGYDWSREIATCREDYYRWTQWIFLKIFNSWYDPERRWTDAAGREVVGGARPIEVLPVPPHVREQGAQEVRRYRDEHRLAYLSESPVNWCPALGTVLANEEVTSEGRSERGDHPVFRRPMKQWMLRITEYADRLLCDLDELDWPEPIKLMQRNWIGRSEGAYVDFELADGSGNVIRVFTTRPDTLFGATYLVLAPEHRLVDVVTLATQRDAVARYVAEAKQKSDLDRTADAKTKTGVFTGAHALNPVNHARIPIWVADYVLASYGTGSIMAVPGSDKRDLEFADAFGLEVIQVVQPPHGPWRGFEGDGTALNSPSDSFGERFAGQCDLNGLPTADAKRRIIAWLEERDLGEGTVQYKLRDWLFSRQRYWGEPFPIYYGPDGFAVGVDEAALPVALPELEDFRPHASDDPNAQPQTPLSRAADWASFERDGVRYQREVNTMPQWAGSCWYYLRFLDPRNGVAFAGPEVERYWLRGRTPDGRVKVGGVDLYMGGAEHAVLHLLYARFWHKVLFDLGYVSTPEPFQRLFNQGMIQGFAYKDARGVYVAMEDVERGADGVPRRRQTGETLTESVEKMSKSLRNVVNPDAIIHEYGADTLRLYEMYLGPLEASKPWNTRDIVGVHRFLQRVWRLLIAPLDGESAGEPNRTASASERREAQAAPSSAAWRINPRIADSPDESLERLLHKTIKKTHGDIERFAFNTAIAQLIVWVNEAQKAPRIGRTQIERFLTVLAPFAPHIADELGERFGMRPLPTRASWPGYDEALTRDETLDVAVQINNKPAGHMQIHATASDAEIAAAVLADTAIAGKLAGRALRRDPIVSRSAKGKLVNLVV